MLFVGLLFVGLLFVDPSFVDPSFVAPGLFRLALSSGTSSNVVPDAVRGTGKYVYLVIGSAIL